VACALINDQDLENRKCWNIRMINGVATIIDLEACKAHQDHCNFICLKNCPTKALRAQIAEMRAETAESEE
jgi:hypothetical protein